MDDLIQEMQQFIRRTADSDQHDLAAHLYREWCSGCAAEHLAARLDAVSINCFAPDAYGLLIGGTGELMERELHGLQVSTEHGDSELAADVLARMDAWAKLQTVFAEAEAICVVMPKTAVTS